MECNIDAAGKKLRFIYGLIMLAAAAVVAVLAGLSVLTGWWPWAVALALALMGGFGVFEARAGWCAVRAMGFKTKY